MKMLTCYLAPTAGRARVAGFDVFDESLEVRRRIGYLPEDTPIYRDALTVLEYLQFAADPVRQMEPTKIAGRIQGDRRTATRPRRGRAASSWASCRRATASSFGLAQAMLHDPDILVLDEPTSGLDPSQIVEIRSALIKEIGREKTVILSTHILPEVQATCRRIDHHQRQQAGHRRHAARTCASASAALATASSSRRTARRPGRPCAIASRASRASAALRARRLGRKIRRAHAFTVDQHEERRSAQVDLRAAVDNHCGRCSSSRANPPRYLEDVFRPLTTGEES